MVVWVLLGLGLVVLSPLAATAEVDPYTVAEMTKSRSTAEIAKTQSAEQEEQQREHASGEVLKRRFVVPGHAPPCLFEFNFRSFSGADQVLSSEEHLVFGDNSHQLGLRKRPPAVVLSVFRL
ncbi:hypothetical protein [Bounagaea algeriensis]